MKIAATALLVAFSATAAQAQTDRFIKAGYIVEVHHDGDAMLLSGRNPASKATFKLTVTPDDHVVGTWNGQHVDYILGHAAKPETIALAGQ